MTPHVGDDGLSTAPTNSLAPRNLCPGDALHDTTEAQHVPWIESFRREPLLLEPCGELGAVPAALAPLLCQEQRDDLVQRRVRVHCLALHCFERKSLHCLPLHCLS